MHMFFTVKGFRSDIDEGVMTTEIVACRKVEVMHMQNDKRIVVAKGINGTDDDQYFHVSAPGPAESGSYVQVIVENGNGQTVDIYRHKAA